MHPVSTVLVVPPRYSALTTHLEEELGTSDPRIGTAIRRIEAARLVAEGDLRDALVRRFTGPEEQVEALRPFDLIGDFVGYAQNTFTAVSDNCSIFFSREHAVESFLWVAEDWIVEQILPPPQTVGQYVEQANKFIADTVHFAKTVDLAKWSGPGEIEALIQQLETGGGGLPEEVIALGLDKMDASFFNEPIIPLDESIRAFWNRTGVLDRKERNAWGRGGDWERVLDDVGVDFIRRNEGPSSMCAIVGELWLALRGKSNRTQAGEILKVAMERKVPYLLATWWANSAESSHDPSFPKSAVSFDESQAPTRVVPERTSAVGSEPFGPDSALPTGRESKGRKRGPKPDYDIAIRLAAVVARVAQDGDWRPKLDEICEALDDENVPSPKKWVGEDPSCRRWSTQADHQKAIKVIDYRLKQAKRQR